MQIIELKERDDISENKKLGKIYPQFLEFLKVLRKKELHQKIIDSINQDIEELNSTPLKNNELWKLFKKKQTKIITFLEREHKIVPKDHYKNRWLAIGMSVFGLPLGMVLGLIISNNPAYFAAGIPIGMCIGIALGAGMDKKAANEGRQLDIKLKY